MSMPPFSFPLPRPHDHPDLTLSQLLQGGQWEAAANRAASHPWEAASNRNHNNSLSSTPPLALACRRAAPLFCVEAVLQAKPNEVRSGGGLALGTPLHEAISNARVPLEVISLLVKADEALNEEEKINGSTTTTRAALLQDVDGQVPLHLLVRRYFSFNPGEHQRDDSPILEAVRELAGSCPEACAVPDRRDFEETPLVLALKADMYAHYDTAVAASGMPGETCLAALLEERIHALVQALLEVHPRSALGGWRGGTGSGANDNNNNNTHNHMQYSYTPLHSAVYHGRCPEVLQLLLEADNRPVATPNARYETPLHFAAMKGESEAVLKVLVNSEPGRRAVVTEDAMGKTPLHWLWIKTIKDLHSLLCDGGQSVIMDLEQHVVVERNENYPRLSSCVKDGALHEIHENNDDDVKKDAFRMLCDTKTEIMLVKELKEVKEYEENVILNETGFWWTGPKSFDRVYFNIMNKLDPPLDYRQMRHLPTDLSSIEGGCIEAVVRILQGMVHKYGIDLDSDEVSLSFLKTLGDDDRTENTGPKINIHKLEAMVFLFWVKVRVLLEAAHLLQQGTDINQDFTKSSSQLISQTGELQRQRRRQKKTNSFPILHTAAAETCCPPAVLEILLRLLSDRHAVINQDGNTPLHAAAMRPLNIGKVMQQLPRQHDNVEMDYHDEILEQSKSDTDGRGWETSALHIVLGYIPPEASRTYNAEWKLPLHLAIDTLVSGFERTPLTQTIADKPNGDAVSHYLGPLLRAFPEGLQQRDGKHGLHPFAQAAAVATETSSGCMDAIFERDSTNIVYFLLRRYPAVIDQLYDHKQHGQVQKLCNRPMKVTTGDNKAFLIPQGVPKSYSHPLQKGESSRTTSARMSQFVVTTSLKRKRLERRDTA